MPPALDRQPLHPAFGAARRDHEEQRVAVPVSSGLAESLGLLDRELSLHRLCPTFYTTNGVG